jgi:hypothetical protein
MRTLKVNDRVSATGTIVGIEEDQAVVEWDGVGPARLRQWNHSLDALTFIEPTEPPTGSVLVKDGISWMHEGPATETDKDSWWSPVKQKWVQWEAVKDGDIIFIPEVS